MAQLHKITAMISNNTIPDKNTRAIITLPPISENYPEGAVGTTAEAVKLLIDGIMDTDQTASTMAVISRISTETYSKIRSNNSVKISKPRTWNKMTEILPQIIPKQFRKIKNNFSRNSSNHWSLNPNKCPMTNQ